MDYSEIMNITNNITIDEKEFEDIDIELSEIEIKNTKKILVKKVNKCGAKSKSRRFVKIAAAFVGVMILAGTGLFLTNPALAEKVDLFNVLGYNNEYNDYSEFVGQTQECKGYKFTIDKLVVTPDKVTLAIKVSSEKSLKRNLDRETELNSVGGINPYITMPGSKPRQILSQCELEYIDDNNACMVYEEQISGDTYKKKGDMKINISNERFKEELKEEDRISVAFDLKVDFSKSFDKTLCTKVNKNIEIGQSKTFIKEMNSSVTGTRINFNGDSNMINYRFDVEVDGKIYNNICGWGCDGEENYGYIKNLTYDVMSKAKSIKIIPIYRAQEEKDNQQNDNDIEVSENMKLPAEISFADNSEGEVYKVEKVDNLLRVYCDFGDKTLDKLSNMDIYTKNDFTYLGDAVIEKDTNRENGYIIEKEVGEGGSYYLRKCDSNIFKAGEPLVVK